MSVRFPLKIIILLWLVLVPACSKDDRLPESDNSSASAYFKAAAPGTSEEIAGSEAVFLLYRKTADGCRQEKIIRGKGLTEIRIDNLVENQPYCLVAIYGCTPSQSLGNAYPKEDMIKDNPISLLWNGYDTDHPGFTLYGESDFIPRIPQETFSVRLRRCWCRIELESLLWKSNWREGGPTPTAMSLRSVFILNAPAKSWYDCVQYGSTPPALSSWENGELLIDGGEGIRSCLLHEYDMAALRPDIAFNDACRFDILHADSDRNMHLVICVDAELDNGTQCKWYYPIELNTPAHPAAAGHLYRYSVSLSGPGSNDPSVKVPFPQNAETTVITDNWEDGGHMTVPFYHK